MNAAVTPIDPTHDLHPDDRVYMPRAGEGYLYYESRLSFMATCGDRTAREVLVAAFFEGREFDLATMHAAELCTVH